MSSHTYTTRVQEGMYILYNLYIVYIMYIVYTRNMSKIGKVTTAQIGEKLFIVDGVSPLRYLDLTKNKVHVYDNRNFFEKLFRRKQKPIRLIVRKK